MHLFLLLILQATAAFAQIDPGVYTRINTYTQTFYLPCVRPVFTSVHHPLIVTKLVCVCVCVFSTLSLCLGYGGWTDSRWGHHSIQPMVRDHWTTVLEVCVTHWFHLWYVCCYKISAKISFADGVISWKKLLKAEHIKRSRNGDRIHQGYLFMGRFRIAWTNQLYTL